MKNLHAVSADKIFTSQQWLTGKAVIVANGIIEDLVSIDNIPDNIEHNYFPGMLVPSFIDIQIYGANKHLFAADPTVKALQHLNDYCLQGGAAHCLPTVATNSNEVILACIDAIKDYWSQDGKGVIGLHVEGPWINKEKRGAHIEEFIHSPNLQEVRTLLDRGRGVIKIITLAPEVCTREVVEFIQSEGVLVSAGHSNATYEQSTEAFDSGIHLATHLYNAMSSLNHRAPGMVGAIFQHPTVMASIIPDGYHVDFAAVAIAKKIMNDRLFIITDAVTETEKGLYPHQLNGDKYESGGVLSGSALTMAKAVKNCVEKVGISLDEALRMASLYPAIAIGKRNEWGKIEKGYSANFTILNDELQVII